MLKVCPSCKVGTEVTEISYPETRHVRMRLTPNHVGGKLIVDSFDANVKEEWCEYANTGQIAEYYCVHCNHQYLDAYTWDDVWDQMIWRRK